MKRNSIETDLIKQISEKLGVGRKEAFDIAIDLLTRARDSYETEEDWDSGHLYSFWVYCFGVWDTGDPHSWHSRRHDADDLHAAARSAWRDYESHERNEPDASHGPNEFYIRNM